MADSFTQVPPNSTGNKVRTRTKVIGADTVHEQAVFQTALPTYYALADAVTFATNKQLITLMNASGSGKMLAVKKLFLINVQTSAVTGVAIRSDVKKITAHSGGTLVTPQTADSNNAVLPAEVTVRTGATSVTEGAIMFPLAYSNDEIGATQAFPSSILLQGLNFIPEGVETQEIRLRPGEGLTLKQITATTVGLFAYLIVFTMDDDV